MSIRKVINKLKKEILNCKYSHKRDYCLDCERKIKAIVALTRRELPLEV